MNLNVGRFCFKAINCVSPDPNCRLYSYSSILLISSVEVKAQEVKKHKTSSELIVFKDFHDFKIFFKLSKLFWNYFAFL
jgi:hypothetical protein